MVTASGQGKKEDVYFARFIERLDYGVGGSYLPQGVSAAPVSSLTPSRVLSMAM